MANDDKSSQIGPMRGGIAQDGRMPPALTPLHKGRTPPNITPKPGDNRGRIPASVTPIVPAKSTPKKK